MVARSLAVAAAVFMVAMALMALTGAGVNLVTAGHPAGYSMPRPLQWLLLGILLVGLIAVEAAGARRRLWLALPLVPVAAYLGVIAGIYGSLFWPVDILMVGLAAAGLRALGPQLFPQPGA